MSLDWDFSSAGGAAMDEDDEVLASNEGSEEVLYVLSALQRWQSGHGSLFSGL